MNKNNPCSVAKTNEYIINKYNLCFDIDCSKSLVLRECYHVNNDELIVVCTDEKGVILQKWMCHKTNNIWISKSYYIKNTNNCDSKEDCSIKDILGCNVSSEHNITCFTCGKNIPDIEDM
jgi:hypothetical protein